MGGTKIMSKTIVVALGGNAILTDDPTAKGQQETLTETAKELVKLIKAGNRVVVTHGNGPQVGNLLLQQAKADSKENPAMPIDTAVAMTQGSIGYWLQNAMKQAMEAESLDKEVATLLTQVVVDEKDPAFENPTKPIGPFLTEEEAQAEAEGTGDTFVEDAGRGYRKVVPSPRPSSIVEYSSIRTLIDADVVTISAGGGGIPVKETEHGYEGVEAVVDKDFASARLASLVEADELIILTGVDNVYINFNEPNQEKLEEVTVSELKEHIADNQFAPGSMLPKVEAAIDFVENHPEGRAYITSLENIESVVGNGSATIVVSGLHFIILIRE